MSKPRFFIASVLVALVLPSWGQVVPVVSAQGAPGTVLLADNFDNPATGKLDKDCGQLPDPKCVQGYRDGEYVLGYQGTEEDMPKFVYEPLPGTYGNASLAVDVRLVGPTELLSVNVGCRSQDPELRSGYFFGIRPATGELGPVRIDDDQAAGAGPAIFLSDAVQRANSTNHVEISCVGTRFSASLNGRSVAYIEDESDGAYREGGMFIALKLRKGSGGTGEARFDNLVVTQR